MSTEDRRTKAQLLSELEDARELLRTVNEQNQELERSKTRVEPVPVASALAGCVRALDVIAVQQNSSYNSSRGLSRDDVVNVIAHLIARYQVDLTVRVVESCSRPHLDDASDEALIATLRSKNYGSVVF